MRCVCYLIPIIAGVALAQDRTPEPRAPIPVSGEALFELETRTSTLDDGTTGTAYIAGPMRIMSPLPKGYPRPTAAGAMEIKRYPSVRRAELTVEASARGGPRWGMNQAFFPLFRHIKERDIAMTAPVEAEVPAMGKQPQDDGKAGDAQDGRTGPMTVSFLYRTDDLGPTGDAEENVRVVDTEPVTVLAMGIRGAMGNDRIEREVDALYQWLETQGATNTGPDGQKADGLWEAAGPPRILGYNGPDVRRGDQWWEVQVPVTWKPVPAADPATGS